MSVNVRGREQGALILHTRQRHTKLTRQLSVLNNQVAPGLAQPANVNPHLCQRFRDQRLRAGHFRFSFAIFSPYLVSDSCAKLKL